MGKKCPHCRLINLAYAQHCDCGYRFPSGGETEETRPTWLDIAALAVAVLTFLLVALPIYLALVAIGAATGAIAMCATAPLWWVAVILALAFVGPLLGGGLAAVRAKKWFIRFVIKHQT
jgi:hypothetical protein